MFWCISVISCNLYFCFLLPLFHLNSISQSSTAGFNSSRVFFHLCSLAPFAVFSSVQCCLSSSSLCHLRPCLRSLMIPFQWKSIMVPIIKFMASPVPALFVFLCYGTAARASTFIRMKAFWFKETVSFGTNTKTCGPLWGAASNTHV